MSNVVTTSKPSARDVGASRKKSLPTRTRAPAKGAIGFTFVDQSEDLKSLADKRIVSSSQRHAIRSHVMKSVRHSENLIGKKRPTGRENSRRSSTKTAAAAAVAKVLPFIECQLESTPPSLTDGDSSPSNTSTTSELQLSTIPPDPSPRLDPFYTLPGNEGPSYALIETLVRYCFETFLPMTFPVERDAESKNQVSSRRGMIMRSKIMNPGSFFGMMAIVAAHRAITSQRHHDLKPSNFDHGLLLFDDDYALMKDSAIRATRSKTEERAVLDDDGMEATFSLIAAATIIGNFHEARIYLEGIRQNLNGSRKLDSSIPSHAFIPMSDTKCAAGTLSRPLFDYPWGNDSDLDHILSKTAPQLGTPMARMGEGFYKLNPNYGMDWSISLGLLKVLRIAVGMCWFGQCSADYPRAVDNIDHEIFRRHSIELEHALLDYVYLDDETKPMILAPGESLIRLTALSMLSSFITQALPSAGLGRALTHHHLNTHYDYARSLSFGRFTTLWETKCLLWVMFQYVHSASGQPEEPYFISVLADLVTELGLVTWESAEDILYSFLYCPAWQRKPWRRIWDITQTFLQRKWSVSSWTSSSST